jgi:hypothetical protein
MNGLTQQVLRIFFFEFWSNFSVCFPIRPLDMRSERKKFLSVPEVCFLDATRFVRLVLTGVRVTNFFNIANFDLVFYTTLIYWLSSYLLVCFPSLSVCPVCLSVCLSLVLKVFMWEHLPICTSVCLSSCRPVILHCLSVFLFVCACLCMSVRLYFCLSGCVFEHQFCYTSAFLLAFLPATYLPACLPACLPAWIAAKQYTVL